MGRFHRFKRHKRCKNDIKKSAKRWQDASPSLRAKWKKSSEYDFDLSEAMMLPNDTSATTTATTTTDKPSAQQAYTKAINRMAKKGPRVKNVAIGITGSNKIRNG